MKDPCGFQGIFARDTTTGELFTYESTDLQTLVMSSVFYGLTNNFPINGHERLTAAIKPPNLENFAHFHFLVDFKDIRCDPSIANPNLSNIVTAVHLRTETEILTEPYIVNMTSNRDVSLSLRQASVLLFKDIPDSIIRSNKIYLVVTLTEKATVQLKDKATSNVFRSPFIPYKSTTHGVAKSVVRGISVGVIDISPVFTDTEKSGTRLPHKFRIHFYAPSPNNITPTDATQGECHGWGSVISNILDDSTAGVIINPRTLAMTVNIKDIGNDESLEESFTPINLPVRTVKANFFNDMYNPQEVIYLNVGRIDLIGIERKVTNIKSVSVKIASRNPDITMNIYSNEEKRTEMKLVSVQPGESIGGRVRINNVNKMNKYESLDIFVYLNGLLMAKGVIPLKDDEKILEYKERTPIPLKSSEDIQLLQLEISTEYPGNFFNVDKEIKAFTELVHDYKNDNTVYEEDVLVVLQKLNMVETTTLLKTIDHLLYTYLEFIGLLMHTGSTINSEKFIEAVFEYFILFLKSTLSSKEKNCRHKLFKMYFKYCNGEPHPLPNVGICLLKCLTQAYHDKRKSNDEYAIALCEFSVFVLLLSVISTSGTRDKWKIEYTSTFEEYCIYLSSSFSHVIVGQYAMLQTYDIWLSILELHFDPKELFTMATMVLMSCEYEIDEWSTSSRKLTSNEHKFLNTKYLLLQRVLLYKPFTDYLKGFEEDDPMILTFFKKCIDTSFVPYALFRNDPSQIDTIRLANAVMIIVIRNITNEKILKNLIKLIPTYCLNFIQIRRYCKEIGLFQPRRTFTTLFPLTFPFPKYYVDSIVNDEIIVEVLMEISTLICQIAKIAHDLYGANLSFKTVINECRNGVNFESPFYVDEMKLSDIELIIRTIRAFFKDDFFPERKWLGITALLARSSFILLFMCQDTMEDLNSLTRSDAHTSVNIKLWCDFFRSILMIANHKIANLPILAPISRKAVYSISGKLRSKAAKILERCWDALSDGGYDKELAQKYGINGLTKQQNQIFRENPTLIRELYIFSLHQDVDATLIGCKIFWCTAVNVWEEDHSFQKCLDYAIPELYNGFQAGRIFLHEYELTCFIQCTFRIIHVSVDDPMFDHLTAFIKEIVGFLHILMEAYKIPKQQEYDDDRIASQIEMFGYLLDANKPELFHRMIYEIYVHSVMKKDFVQAALSLELLSSTYSWDPNDTLHAISYPPLPEQSSFDRKEYLYKEAAKYFSKGLKLEKTLSVYKDLIKAYDEINYNLDGLAFAYSQISSTYRDLQSVDRLVPTYFKVSFLGFGFSSAIRNKIFIFEGLPFEHITSMQNRLVNVYHGSTIIQSAELVDKLLLRPTMGKCIHVATVEPRFHLSEDYTRSSKTPNMNNKVRMYIENRDLNTFSSSRRLPGATSVSDLWVEESTYTTVGTFPTLMYRSEIIETQSKKLSPVENAIRSLQVKIQELSGLLNMGHKLLKENGDTSEVFEELSRNLTGTISAPVNGGSMQYKVFLKKPLEDELDAEDVRKLQAAYDELTISLKACLSLHQDLLPSKEFKEAHSILEELFQENFSEEIKKNKEILDGPSISLNNRPLSRRNSIKNPGVFVGLSSWERPITPANYKQPMARNNDATSFDDWSLNKTMVRRNSKASSSLHPGLVLSRTISNESLCSESTMNTTIHDI